MAEDKSQKTEKPTPKHKRDARRDGRVRALGRDRLLVLARGRRAGAARSRQARRVRGLRVHEPGHEHDGEERSLPVGRALGTRPVDGHRGRRPDPARGAGAAAFAAYGQVGLHISPGALGFKWNKISPATGIKRIFSVRGAWEIDEDGLPPDDPRRDRLQRLDRHLIDSLLGPGDLAHRSRRSPRPRAASSVSSATSRVPRLCWLWPTTPSSAASSTTR